MPDEAATEAVSLGLEPLGYLDPETGRRIPWAASATELGIEEECDEPYTVLDYLTDQAGVQGMYLTEYLALDEDDDDDDPAGDDF